MYADHIRKEMGLVHSKTDSCVFMKFDANGSLLFIALLHIDNTQIAGTQSVLLSSKKVLVKVFNSRS